MTLLAGPDTERFVAESNRIEGIHRVTEYEIDAHEKLWNLDLITAADLEGFVSMVAARPLRRNLGQDVRVGGHLPPPGGPAIERALAELLHDIHLGGLTPYEAHVRYEQLHPFMDGNGRSGRALWAWQMLRDDLDPFALGFLHRFYYQTLDASRSVD